MLDNNAKNLGVPGPELRPNVELKADPTPPPWKWFINYHCPGPLKGCYIDDAAGSARIADILSQAGVGSQAICEANAAFIVRAVNAHEMLVKALTAAIHAMRGYQYGNSSPDLAEEVEAFANAALALASAEPISPQMNA